MVFISCGEMMCLSLPKPFPGVYQHHLTSFNSLIFLINMSINIELKKILFIYSITVALRFLKNVTVISYNIINLFLKNKNEKRLRIVYSVWVDVNFHTLGWNTGFWMSISVFSGKYIVAWVYFILQKMWEPHANKRLLPHVSKFQNVFKVLLWSLCITQYD